MCYRVLRVFRLVLMKARSIEFLCRLFGALFRLPREIRDSIYRLLVKGRYLAVKPSLNSEGRLDIDNNTGLDFSILRVSKVVSCEAAEILYSESVFRFILYYRKFFLDFNDFRKVAPKMMNIILDVDEWTAEAAEQHKILSLIIPMKDLRMNIKGLIGLFGGLETSRRNVHIRVFNCDPATLENTAFTSFCQRFEVFVGFRTALIEVFSDRFTTNEPFYRRWDDAQKAQEIRQVVNCVILGIKEQLEPALGPASSGFKSDAGNLPTPEWNVLHLDGTSLVGFLEFHPRQHAIEKSTSQEDRLQ